ncbi:MAG: nucleoside/nucleotide kinase family protein [Pseudonocardiaceae bacterium]|nr:nucleoside/nucleotide kinase family protein [Pseudonocardiaceae bacterium]
MRGPELTRRAQRLATGRRRILGIAGAPGSGKSTLAAGLAGELGAHRAVCVGLDGFHLAGEELSRLGRSDRKGAPDTFDGHGYVAMLRRLRAADEPVVYVPRFDRQAETAVAGAIPVPASTPLVITEGNYLLDGEPPWDQVRALLDEVWFVEVDERARRDRLIARHIAHGRAPGVATAWADGPDQRNAERIVAGAHRADLLVTPE